MSVELYRSAAARYRASLAKQKEGEEKRRKEREEAVKGVAIKLRCFLESEEGEVARDMLLASRGLDSSLMVSGAHGRSLEVIVDPSRPSRKYYLEANREWCFLVLSDENDPSGNDYGLSAENFVLRMAELGYSQDAVILLIKQKLDQFAMAPSE